jgi:fructose 1,6-bisphosphatase
MLSTDATVPTWTELFRRMDSHSQNAIALMIRDGARLNVNHLLGIIHWPDFIDEAFFAQMAGYGPWFENIEFKYRPSK